MSQTPSGALPPRLLVKLCGLRHPRDVQAAVDAGADLLGFVFAPSVRRVSPEAAAGLCRDLPEGVRTVAVFHEPGAHELARVLALFPADLVQVEGRRALPPRTGRVRVLHDDLSFEAELAHHAATADPGDLVLLDPAGEGGRGLAVSRDRARQLARRFPLLLAGGLRPDNVGAAVAAVQPRGVDVSSGIEARRGHKDPARMADFVAAARAAEAALRPPSPTPLRPSTLPNPRRPRLT